MPTPEENIASIQTHIEYVRESLDEIKDALKGHIAADDKRYSALQRKLYWGLGLLSGFLTFLGLK